MVKKYNDENLEQNGGLTTVEESKLFGISSVEIAR